MPETKQTTLVSLAVAKQYLNFVNEEGDPTNENDEQLVSWIDGLSERIESITRRKFVTQDVTLKRKNRSPILFLPFCPVNSISKFEYKSSPRDNYRLFGTDVEAETPSSEQLTASANYYSFDEVTGQIYTDERLDNLFVRITYNCGYGARDSKSLPQSVVLALLDWLKYESERHSTGGSSTVNVSFGGFSMSANASPPGDIFKAIMSYRRRL